MKFRTHFGLSTRVGIIPAVLAIFACAATLIAAAPSSANDHRRDRDRSERGRVHRPVRHRYPVYIPPPIYYPRYESPGISIVIPFDLR